MKYNRLDSEAFMYIVPDEMRSGAAEVVSLHRRVNRRNAAAKE